MSSQSVHHSDVPANKIWPGSSLHNWNGSKPDRPTSTAASGSVKPAPPAPLQAVACDVGAGQSGAAVSLSTTPGGDGDKGKLVAFYNSRNKKPNYQDREQLSRETGLSSEDIKRWYVVTRMRNPCIRVDSFH